MTELQFSRLGPEDIDELYLAIREIMEENETHNVDTYDKNSWKWQYQDLPGKTSYVYVGKNIEGKILAYYHVPVYAGNAEGKEERYAMIQDVAVSQTLRGQGVFKRLAIYANEDLDAEGIPIVYTFPNHKSIHTFKKYNDFTFLGTLPSYLMPLDNRMLIGSKISFWGIHKVLGAPFNFLFKLLYPATSSKGSVEVGQELTSEITTIYSEFGSNYNLRIHRNKEYITWRYRDKPKQQTFILNFRNEQNVLTASIILKEDLIMGIPTLLLMDFAHIDQGQKDLVRLLKQVRLKQESFFGKKFGLLFLTSFSRMNNYWRKAGSFKLPEKIVPRPLNLLSRSHSGIPIGKKEDWLITLSDWDVL